MIITNKKNLPEGIVAAVKKDYYTKGGAKFSTTELLKPPQLRRLTFLHFDEITVDVSNEIFKLFGSAVHHILDRATKDSILSNAERQTGEIGLLRVDYEEGEISSKEYIRLVAEILGKDYTKEDENIIKRETLQEKRFYLSVGDISISGAPDWYDKTTKKIEDYKVTTVYKVTKGDRSDWEAQLNVYALLLINGGYPVEKLQINAILKDFSRKDLKRIKEDEYYPDCAVATIDIPLWKPLDTLKWLIAAIEDQMQVDELMNAPEIYAIRPCTLEEKWQKPTRYALMKKGGKRASAVFDTETEASGASIAKGNEYFIEIRQGYAIRCEEYCSVKNFCAQYKAENTTEVSYDEMKTDALKKLENIVPEVEIVSPETEAIADLVTDLVNYAPPETEIPPIPEIIKPIEKDADTDIAANLTNLMDEL